MLIEVFQSTRPQGARHFALEVHRIADMLQSTRPQGARPTGGRCASSTLGSFNPRARKGRDFEARVALLHLDLVSIHAPARGATARSLSPPDSSKSFQSTRPQGARHGMASKELGMSMFQSTRPQGARPLLERSRTTGRGVSIHAPARGATAFDLVKNEKAQGKNIIALRPQSIYLEK